MKTFLVFILLTIFLTGCVPLTELSQVSGPTHPEVSLYDRCVRAGFDLNHERIDTQQSYIKSPAGRRYSLQVQTNQFDIDQKYDRVSALLYPFDADGLPLHGWRKGTWSYHFVVESNGVPEIIDQQWKCWTFYYCPIIHGPPN